MHGAKSSFAKAWYRLGTRRRLARNLDAPIHLHGHEMFVAGDVDRILALFAADLWADVTAERWRYDHDPLPRYPTPAADVGHVRGTIKSYDLNVISDLQTNGTVWLLAITAVKPPPSPDACPMPRIR